MSGIALAQRPRPAHQARAALSAPAAKRASNAPIVFAPDLLTAKPAQFEKQLDARLDSSLDLKLDRRLDDKTDAELDRKFGAQLDGKLDGRIESKADDRLDDKQEERGDDRQEDGKPKDGKEAPAEEGGVDDNQGATTRQKDGAGGKIIPAGKRRAKAVKPSKSEAGQAGVELEARPQTEEGAVSLPRAPVRASDAGEAFRSPAPPAFRSMPRAGGKPEPPLPERERALTLFRDAIEMASRLHAELLADGREVVEKTRAGAENMAAKGQRELDGGIGVLAAALARSHVELDRSADSTLAYLQQRRRQTRAQISREAQAAFGALGGAKTTAEAAYEKHKKASEDRGTEADGKQATVVKAGKDAEKAVTGLNETKEVHFPTSGEPMDAAVNEAVQIRLPARTVPRAKAFADESTAQNTALTAAFTKLKSDLKAAFGDIKTKIGSIATSNADSISKARDGAYDRVETTTRQLQGSIDQARAKGHATLIRQHNQARRQLIETHRERAQGEVSAAQSRASRGASAATGAAGGQQSAANTLSESLAREQARPPQDLARVVISSATAFLKNAAKTGPEQRTRIVASAQSAELGATRQAEASGGRLAGAAAKNGAQLEEAGQAAGGALREQIERAADSFAQIPTAVTGALKSALPAAVKGYAAQNADAGDKVTKAGTAITNTLAGTGGGDGNTQAKGDAATGQQEGGNSAKGPREKPDEFRTKASGIAGKPESEPGIVELAKTAGKEIPSNIRGRAGELYRRLKDTSTNVESVMAQLRKLTALQGNALRRFFSDTYNGRNLESMLRSELRKFFSADSTNDLNIDAAVNYLNGNRVAAAMAELKAAVNYSNDEGRAEKVKRSLSSAELDQLNRSDPAAMKEIGDDLSDTEKQVFNALDKVKPLDNLKGKALDDQKKANREALGEANAIGLQKVIDQAREKKGEAGGDEVVDKVGEFRLALGSDVLSGGDAISPALQDPETAKEREKEQAELWKATDSQFEKIVTQLPDGSRNVSPPGSKQNLGAIARYASAAKTYTEFVPNENGQGGYYKTVTKGLDPKQAQVIQDLVKHGPNSEEFAASTVEFELDRKGGKPREDRMRKALLGEDLLAAREGESDEARAKRLKGDGKDDIGDLQRAKDRKKAVMSKLAERRAAESADTDGKAAAPKKPEEVQADITAKLDERFEGDESGKKYTKSMIESETLEPDPKAAFDFALAHKERNKETLEATVGRMNRTDIKKAVKEWDARPENKDNPLYKQLGLYGKGDGKLEGDTRNEIELKFKGVPRNDLERAENAYFVAEQQTRDGTKAGQALAAEDYNRMTKNQAKILELMGVKREDINEFGEIDIKTTDAQGNKIKARFNEKGELEVKNPKDRDAFETAVQMSHTHAEAYKESVDRITQGIVMALVIAAAVITTFVTFGGAAAIWGPILITAAAGIAGMGVNAAIRGDRYTKAEMQRDLVMTFVQAATAGLGAWAGAAAKGAGAAGKVASTGQKVVGQIAGKTATQGVSRGAKLLQFGKALGKEAIVGGGTNALNSAAGAYMDPENRRKGQSWDKAVDGGLKGFGSGALGAIVTKPFSAIGRVPGRGLAVAGGRLARPGSVLGGRLGKPLASVGRGLSEGGERLIGNVAGGFTTRLAEARIGQALGDPHQTFSESLETAKEGIAQDAIQAAGEQVAHGAAGRRAARKTATAPPAHAPPAVEAAHPPRPRTTEPVPEHTRIPRGPSPHDTGASLARTAALHEALPPDVRSAVDTVVPDDHPLSKRSRHDEQQALRRQEPQEAAVAEPVAPGAGKTGKAASHDEPALQVRSVDGRDPRPDAGVPQPIPEEITKKTNVEELKRDHEKAQAALKAKEERKNIPRTMDDHIAANDGEHRPIHDQVDLTYEKMDQLGPMPIGSHITASDPKDAGAARRNYDILKSRDPNREVLLVRHPESGEFRVVQGDFDSARKPGKDWIIERHSHPRLISDDLQAQLTRSLPSASEGDFAVLKSEIDNLSKNGRSDQVFVRTSKIDIEVNGIHSETNFVILKQKDEYALIVTFNHPKDGPTTIGPFKDIAAYEAHALKLTGVDFSKPGGERVGTVRAAGGESGADPPRAAHGDALSPEQRAAIDKTHKSMAEAEAIQQQIGGAHPALGYAAATADAHRLMHDLGLVGRNDSMVRLHNIINDPSIPHETRAAVAKATLNATRAQMIEAGALKPGEDVHMIFHGAPEERTASLKKGGIDTSLIKGGGGDDFGRALYFTSDLEAAERYSGQWQGEGQKRTQKPGQVFPFIVRSGDLGTVVDVRTGGKDRAAWNQFLDGKPRGYPHAAVPGPWETTREFLVRGGIEHRGNAFNAFVAQHLAGKPNIVHGTLGEPGLTGGIGKGDQFALRADQPAGSQLVTKLNEQLGFRQPGAGADSGTVRSVRTKDPKPSKDAQAFEPVEPEKQPVVPVKEKIPKHAKRDNKQGKQVLDGDAALRTSREAEHQRQRAPAIEDEIAAARRRLANAEDDKAALDALRPSKTPEADAILRKLADEPDLEERHGALQEQLADPTLKPETRKYLDWQLRRWGLTIAIAEAHHVLARGPQKLKEQHEVEIPKAEAAQRDANRSIKKQMEKRGPNYRRMKNKAEFDEILQKTRFDERDAAARAAPNGKPLGISPDHLIPLDEIANMPELLPLFELHRDASPKLKAEILKALIDLGDIPKNLVAMRSDANANLKNKHSWHDIGPSDALERQYGYTGDDIRKMRDREDQARAMIREHIAEAIKEFRKKLAAEKKGYRRGPIIFPEPVEEGS